MEKTNNYTITRDYEFLGKPDLVSSIEKRKSRRKTERKIKGKKKFGFK